MTERTFEEQKKITQETLSQCDYGTLTNRIMVFLYTHLESSVEHAYAVDRSKCRVKTKSDVFAEGCSFYKLVLPFIIGAFIGDVVETLFFRAAAGVWMSRSSLVLGPFSIVWGIAIVMATYIMYNYRDRSDGFVFAFGTFICAPMNTSEEYSRKSSSAKSFGTTAVCRST